MTGIPLAELERYESEFADLLPEPRWSPAAPPGDAEAAPGTDAPTRSERTRAGHGTGLLAQCRQVWQWATGIVFRVLGWTRATGASRLLREWLRPSEPA